MNESEQKAAAKNFAETWKGRGYEKGETHSFWLELLHDVYGVENLQADPKIILLENLEKEYYRLQFLVNVKSQKVRHLCYNEQEMVNVLWEAVDGK